MVRKNQFTFGILFLANIIAQQNAEGLYALMLMVFGLVLLGFLVYETFYAEDK